MAEGVKAEEMALIVLVSEARVLQAFLMVLLSGTEGKTRSPRGAYEPMRLRR